MSLDNVESKDTESTAIEGGDGFGIEQVLKKYVLPTIEDLWAKLKIETQQSLTMGQTLFYTVEQWVSDIRASKTYYVMTTSAYYLGGFLFKSTIVEPTYYFLDWFSSASAHWVKTVSVKFYTEVSDMMEKFRDYLFYPGVEAVIFVDKSLGSIFYIFGIPIILSYKTFVGTYYLSKEIVNRVGNDIYYSLYSTKPPKDPNDVEDVSEEEDVSEDDDEEHATLEEKSSKESLGWDLAKIILPAVATTVVVFSVIKSLVGKNK